MSDICGDLQDMKSMCLDDLMKFDFDDEDQESEESDYEDYECFDGYIPGMSNIGVEFEDKDDLTPLWQNQTVKEDPVEAQGLVQPMEIGLRRAEAVVMLNAREEGLYS